MHNLVKELIFCQNQQWYSDFLQCEHLGKKKFWQNSDMVPTALSSFPINYQQDKEKNSGKKFIHGSRKQQMWKYEINGHPEFLKLLWAKGSELTLQPAFPKANAIAFPIPLEAPVTTTTGASTVCAASALACSIVATWALTPACAMLSMRSALLNKMVAE